MSFLITRKEKELNRKSQIQKPNFEKNKFVTINKMKLASNVKYLFK